MNRLSLLALLVMTFALTAATQAQNVLLNSGFETDALEGQDPQPFATDWSIFGDTSTVSANLFPVRTGVGALRLNGAGGFTVPGAFQTFPASPGQTWDLQGYMRTEDPLPAGGVRGLLKIVFGDGVGDLEPAAINIGQADAQPFPGILSNPLLNVDSPVDTWQFTQAQGVAPEGTVEVRLFALFVDEFAGTAYFDDLQGMLIVDEETPGDFNEDGEVDGRDFLDWQRGGSPTPLSAADLAEWQTSYVGGGLAAVTAVPEPSSAILLAAGLALMGRQRFAQFSIC